MKTLKKHLRIPERARVFIEVAKDGVVKEVEIPREILEGEGPHLILRWREP